MAGAHYRRAGEIFLEAVALEGAERADHVARACAGDEELLRMVELLLEGDRTGTSPLDGAPPLPPSSSGDVADDAGHDAGDPPETIGPYRVLREIGRGGMGRIYLAERADDDFRQEVAIKVMHPALAGPDRKSVV